MINTIRRLWSKRKYKKRSPLKEAEVASLRYPGQSISVQREKNLESYMDYAIMSFMLISATGISWFVYLSDDQLSSLLLVTIISCGVAVVFTPSAIRHLLKARRLKDAQNGERIVAEYLNQLIAENYKVFHDIPCYEEKRGKEKIIFNIDHLLVGEKGIFAIDTKTLQKTVGEKNQKLYFNGESISYDIKSTYLLKDNPITKITSQVRWLEQRLISSTGKNFSIMPVLVFPGWYIKNIVRQEDVRILGRPTLKALKSMLLIPSPPKYHLSKSDVELVCDRIKIQIRNMPDEF